jgi:molybdopterin synthase catalytic subunit
MVSAAVGDEWCELTTNPLPIAAIYEWAVRPDCGAVVLFSGTVRDHAEGRTDVTSLDYEAYDEAALPAFQKIVQETRQRFPDARRIAIIHRTGRVDLSESSVVVAVSSPHRPVAFDAARFAIDALKESAPIWKKENWVGGSDWGTGAHDVVPPSSVGRSS